MGNLILKSILQNYEQELCGYQLIVDEKVTIESMKNHNEKGYSYIKDKVQFAVAFIYAERRWKDK